MSQKKNSSSFIDITFFLKAFGNLEIISWCILGFDDIDIDGRFSVYFKNFLESGKAPTKIRNKFNFLP
jgi:hypothetical protein